MNKNRRDLVVVGVTDSAGVAGEVAAVRKAGRRTDKRLPKKQHVRLCSRWHGFGYLRNLSRAGAEIHLADDQYDLSDGDAATLEFLDGMVVTGVVIWRRGASIGMEFDLKFADASELLNLDYLGRDLFLSVVRQQKLRADDTK